MSEFIVYAQYDLFSLIIMVLLIIRTVTLSKSLEYQKVYLVMMLMSVVLVCSDMVYEYSGAGVIYLSETMLYFVNIVYFTFCIFISYAWLIYTELVTKSRLCKNKVVNAILLLPAVALFLALLTTYSTRWVFYFDETGYHRGSINVLYMLVPLAYFIGACLLAHINVARRKTDEAKAQYRTVISFALCPVVAVALQAVLVGFPAVCVGCMVGMIQLFLNDIVRDRENLIVAETTTKSKNNFFAGMSHELRTPINAIIGMNTMILREAEDETIRGYASNVDNAGKLLLTLVNDILDISKIEAGKMILIPGDVDVRTLIMDLEKMISQRAREKKLNFIVEADPNLPSVISADEVRVRQIILNMLTNALKYTSEGYIRATYKLVSSKDGNAAIMVAVTDSGRGMRPEEIENLFSPYERIDVKKDRKIEGTGLGLSICKQLLGLMNSKMDVDSKLGKGSTFSFTITVPVVDGTGIGVLSEEVKPEAGPKRESNGRYKAAFFAKKARVLAVDDTVVNLKVFKALLKSTGITVDTCVSGHEALEAVKMVEYDMIFIDIMMPEMDGVETLEAIKKQENLVDYTTPMIALTANALSGAREEYLDAGFTDYLSKPIDVEKLEEMIMKYLPPSKIDEPQ